MLALLSVGHLVADLAGGALPALLPFFQQLHGLSYGSLGLISGIFQFTASGSQPLFGYLTDRLPGRVLLPAAGVVAGGGIALTGLAPNYTGLLALVVVASVGIAAFHPLGYRIASEHSGPRRATATSIFTVGGNLGVAIGPLLATPLVLQFGRPGTLGLFLPGAVIGALIWWLGPRVAPPAATRQKIADGAVAIRSRIVPMGLLTLVVILRSAATNALSTFVPLYYLDEIGAPPLAASRMLSLLLFSGAVGTIVGGPLSDRWGRLRLVTASLAIMPVALVLFIYSQGVVASVALAITGGCLVSSFAVTVVMAQELWPENVGVASGVMVGFAFGMGGLLVPLIGLVAEHWGLVAALQTILVFPIGALVVTGALAVAMTRAGIGHPAPAPRPVSTAGR